MNTFLRAAALTVVIMGSSGIPFLAQAPDPLLGTWDLNVAQSKYTPGPAPKSETRTYVATGQDVKATAKTIGSDGKPTSAEWTMSYDGKDRPITGNPDADTLSIQGEPHRTTFTLKKAGKVVITGTRTISKDGKTMTLTAKGVNAAGQTIDEVEVFEKR